MVKTWRPSVALTITLTVILAMVLGFSLRQVQLLGLPYLGISKQQLRPQTDIVLHQGFPERVALLVNTLDDTPPDARLKAVEAADRPDLRFQIVDGAPPIADHRPGQYANFARHKIESNLVRQRPVIVAENVAVRNENKLASAFIQDHSVTAEIPITTSLWLVATGIPDSSRISSQVQDVIRATSAGWIALSFLLAVALSYVAAGRIVGPLSMLAAAAAQIGAKGDVPPLKARGPKEVHEVVQAFSQMQERLQRFVTDRTRMIGAMSHDLRTPLTRLKMRVEMLTESPEQTKMLAEIDSMCKVIDSILTFARDDAAAEPRSLIDLSSLVEGICEDAADAGEPVTFSGPRHVTVLGRSASLRRAISNVIENAVRYGKRALVTIEETASSALVIIEDEGPGIPRHERERVFDPFYRVEASRDPDSNGVGLGLSVSRSIILEHGGDVSLGTRKGGGLSVRIELPVQLRTSSPRQ